MEQQAPSVRVVCCVPAPDGASPERQVLSVCADKLRFTFPPPAPCKIPATDREFRASEILTGGTGAQIASAYLPKDGGSAVAAWYGPAVDSSREAMIDAAAAAAAHSPASVTAFTFDPCEGGIAALTDAESTQDTAESDRISESCDVRQQLEAVRSKVRTVGGHCAVVVEIRRAGSRVSFVCLPDSERPAMPGLLCAAGAERYERVQAFNGDVLSLFRSALHKYSRLAFGRSKMQPYFREWFGCSQPGSDAAAAAPPPPARAVLLLTLATHGSPHERLHEFTAARRVLTMHSGWDGPITRHQACEAAQMESENRKLSLQLDAAAAAFGHRPRPGTRAERAAVMAAESADSERRREERARRARDVAEHRARQCADEERAAVAELRREKKRAADSNQQLRSDLALLRSSGTRAELERVEADMDGVAAARRRELLDLEAELGLALSEREARRLEREDPRAKQARWAAAQCASLQEASIRDLRTAVTRSGEELRRAAEGQRCAALASSAAGLEQLLPALMPAAPPAPLQAERIERARRRAADVVAQETAALQRTSAAACVGGGQVRKVWLRAESVVGLAATGGPYGVSAARGGCVQRAAVGGADELAFLTRLRPAGAQTDVVACAVTEAGTEGAVLAFDADLTALAALPAGPAVLTLPAAGERGPVRIHVHVRSVAMRPKQQAAPATPSPRRAASSPRRADTTSYSPGECTPSLGGRSCGDESGSGSSAAVRCCALLG